MPQKTKTTRKTTKKPTRSSVRVGGSSKKNSSLFGRLLSTRRGYWTVLVLVMVLAGGVGTWRLVSSHASTFALTPAQCYLRGRTGSYQQGSNYLCEDGQSVCNTEKSGTWTVPSGGFGYCTGSVTKASSITKDKCTSLGRVFVGAIGCARRWQQTNAKGVVQCLNSSNTYYVQDSYDKCAPAGSTASSGSIIVGSISPVGNSYGGVTDCVAFIKWVMTHHTNAYNGGSTGNGGQVAANLRNQFGWKNVRAPHAIVSMPNGDGGWSPGHVALVIQVKSDGSIVVEESNWNGHHDTRAISASAADNMQYAYSGADWH